MNEKGRAGVARKSADAKQLGGWVLGGHYHARKLTYAEHRLNTESAIAAEGREGSNPSTSSLSVSRFTIAHAVKQVRKGVR